MYYTTLQIEASLHFMLESNHVRYVIAIITKSVTYYMQSFDNKILPLDPLHAPSRFEV